MSKHTNENVPAHPIVIPPTTNITYTCGLTAREHAAIHLRVPMSGNPWLDEMITEARRWDAAQAVLTGKTDWDDRSIQYAADVHDALTRQMKGGAR